MLKLFRFLPRVLTFFVWVWWIHLMCCATFTGRIPICLVNLQKGRALRLVTLVWQVSLILYGIEFEGSWYPVDLCVCDPISRNCYSFMNSKVIIMSKINCWSTPRWNVDYGPWHNHLWLDNLTESLEGSKICGCILVATVLLMSYILNHAHQPLVWFGVCRSL